jgi:hypothetical protein
MAPQTGQPPLVYDRVGENRRRTWILIALSFAVLIPSVLVAGYLLARLLILLAAVLASEFGRESAAQAMAAWRQHMLGFTLVTASGVAAVLGILFWAIASSPSSRLLVQAGARTAGAGEGDLKHLVENLAIGAGLPAPKLYISDSSTPNAFAVGTRPEHAALVVTDWTFGYILRSVELLPIPDLIPSEVYDSRSRAAAEAPLPPLPSVDTRRTGLSPTQILIAILFGVVLFAGLVLILLKYGG